MTADIEHLVLEHLRAIRTDVTDVKESLGRVELGLSTLGRQVGTLMTAVHSGRSELDDFRRRIERIERRLELKHLIAPDGTKRRVCCSPAPPVGADGGLPVRPP